MVGGVGLIREWGWMSVRVVGRGDPSRGDLTTGWPEPEDTRGKENMNGAVG